MEVSRGNMNNSQSTLQQQQQLHGVCALEKQMFLNACKSTRAIKRIVPMKIFSNTNTMQTKSHLAKQNLVICLP
jgi:hypothetical protein